MATTTWPVYSPFAKEHFGRGKAEGKAEGIAEGEAEAVLLVLEARGLSVSDEQRDHIMTCTDVKRLRDWVRLAVSVVSADDLFR